MATHNVTKWRHSAKKLLIDGAGGKCAKCGYSKCRDALDFHHIDDSNKKFTISNALSHPKSWARIIEEVKKCVLLCANCHRELHAGLWKISEIEIVLFTDKNCRRKRNIVTGRCPVCSKSLRSGNTCSKRCAALLRAKHKINWPSNGELKNLLGQMSKCALAKKLGVSDAAITKRLKRQIPVGQLLVAAIGC